MITINTMFNDVIGGFSDEYPMIEYYEKNEKKLVYKKDYIKKIDAIAASLEEMLKDVEKGRFIGIKHETHPFWLAVFYALEKIGYNVMFLDENANDIVLKNCIGLGNLAAIVGKEKESYPVMNIDFEKLVMTKEGSPKNVCWASQFCLCTSGTTGIAKTVVFKAETMVRIHRVVRATLLGHAYSLESMRELPIDNMRVMATLPMRHVFGFQVPSVYIGFGCTLVFPKNQGVLELVRTIREEKIWMTYGVPALWKAIFNVYKNQADEISEESFENFFGKQFKKGLIGGAKIDEEMKPFLKQIGFYMADTYGSTETGGCITLGYLTEDKALNGMPGYSGQKFNNHDAGVMDGHGNWNKTGKGELVVKGLNIYDGILREGKFVSRIDEYGEFLHTGDMFEIDNEDFYCIGRVDNMIVNDAGENIYVEELEEDFSFLRDKASQYAAIGINNKPVLVVYGSDSTEEELLQEIASENLKLKHYKRVEKIFFTLEKLPLTSKNEVDRKSIEGMLDELKKTNEEKVHEYNLKEIMRKEGR